MFIPVYIYKYRQPNLECMNFHMYVRMYGCAVSKFACSLQAQKSSNSSNKIE